MNILHISPSINNNNKVAFDENTADINSSIAAHGIIDKRSQKYNWFEKFSRLPSIDPYNALTTTREYLFFTKPDLRLFEVGTTEINSAVKNIPFFANTLKNHIDSALQLQSSAGSSSIPLMSLLSNSVSSPLSVPDSSSDTIESAVNIMGTSINYRGTSYKSDQDYDFSLEFDDNKYLDVYMLFKIYDEYEKHKWQGNINYTIDSQNPNDHWANYILNKVLHDQISIYKFLVAEDGSRIIYWARYTGCFPTSTSRDTFSDLKETGGLKININWKCNFFRDMDPVILYQFNRLIRDKISSTRDYGLYDTTNLEMDSRWAVIPYIDYKDSNNKRTYFLKWRI